MINFDIPDLDSINCSFYNNGLCTVQNGMDFICVNNSVCFHRNLIKLKNYYDLIGELSEVL